VPSDWLSLAPTELQDRTGACPRVAGYAGGAQGKPAVGASDAITAAPWSDHDPYTDAALLDPWLGYKQLRDALRDVLRRPLTPRALPAGPRRGHRGGRALGGETGRAGSFDAATDLANHLPVTVVSNLIGLPPRRPRADAGLGRGDVQLLRADE
jgi:hypothetical protein